MRIEYFLRKNKWDLVGLTDFLSKSAEPTLFGDLDDDLQVRDETLFTRCTRFSYDSNPPL